MDDMLLADDNIEVMSMTKFCFQQKFEIKDMGDASYVLGIRINRDCKVREKCLDQEKYIMKS